MYICIASNGIFEWACYTMHTAPLPQRYICVCACIFI